MSYIIGADFDLVTSTKQFALGSIAQGQDGKLYKYITYSHEAAAVDGVTGEVAYYVAATGYGNSDVTSDLTASDEVGAGVIQATMADNDFGWVQIKGFATLSISLQAATDGAPYTPTGGADGNLDVATAATDSICATGADTSAKEIMCDFVY